MDDIIFMTRYMPCNYHYYINMTMKYVEKCLVLGFGPCNNIIIIQVINICGPPQHVKCGIVMLQEYMDK
jgi:hypothetical protein